MTNILITGCAGFIGSNLIRYLLFNEKDIKIFGIDKLDKYSDFHNVYLNKSMEFFLANIDDIDILKRIFKFNNPEYVIHLASSNLDMNYNIKGLTNIISVCKEFDCKLIYISSVGVYNNLDKNVESSIVYAKDMFSTYQMFYENLIQFSDIKYNIIRAPEVFGPRQQKGIIVDMFLDIKGNEKIVLNNTGNIIRDLLHVEDFSFGVLTLLQNWKNNELYNLSANIDFTDLEIASMIVEILKEGKIEFDKEELQHQQIDIDCSKIRNLKWKPIKKFKVRVQETIYWYNQNKWFFK